jgi:hypothetical protein
MSYTIRRVNYFHLTVKNRPGKAYQMLEQFADQGVNLLAFSASPTGPASTQLTVFPENTHDLEDLTKKLGLSMFGPFSAFMINGKDELGALTHIHKLLYMANVDVYASSGVTDGKNNYGYILYVRHDEYEKAAQALGI